MTNQKRSQMLVGANLAQETKENANLSWNKSAARLQIASNIPQDPVNQHRQSFEDGEINEGSHHLKRLGEFPLVAADHHSRKPSSWVILNSKQV